MRQTLDLTGEWDFQLATLERGKEAEYHEGGKTGGWIRTTVPCSFDDAIPNQEFYEGPGWFRTRFQVPASWEG